MAWNSPIPNLMDFYTYIYLNGIGQSNLPSPLITIINAGSGYDAPPNVFIQPPLYGIPMSAAAYITAGSVSSILFITYGVNYGFTPTITLSAPLSGTGTQATAAITLGSPWPASALSQAMNRTISSAGTASAALTGELPEYTKACYALGFHLLLLSAQDISGQTFFADIRKTYELNSFRPGIMLAAGDQATSQTYIVPRFFHEITMEGLEATKTPWGRQWLEYQQMYGYTIFDMT